MYTKCVYRNCDNTSSTMSMFRFPINDPGRLLLWIRNSGNIHLDSLCKAELGHRFICGAHFIPSSIHVGNLRTRLIGPAVPIHYLSLNKQEEIIDVELPENMECLVSSPEVLKVKTPSKFYGRKRSLVVNKPISPSSSSSSTSKHTLLDMVHESPQHLSRRHQFEGPKKRLSRKSLFEENIADTPKTRKMKTLATSLIKQNKAQQAKINRLSKVRKNKSIGIVQGKYRSEFSKTLALMQLREAKNKSKWSDEEKNICLSLFYKSPSAYYFLRRQGVVLAAPNTIRHWLAKSDCLPGLNADIFYNIMKKFENVSFKDRACIISFDEMSIMSNLEYSKKFDFIEGFEDLGSNRRSNKSAKCALVFLVRAIYGQWKVPVAYFLSKTNVKAEMLQLLIKSIINKLFEHGLLPKAIVCDQATTNQNVLKRLGVTKDSPFFFCNEKKIFALYDVPHLVKSLRNNLLYNDFINGNEQISFKDIINTYQIDKASKLSCTMTKLTEKHVSPNSFQKMNVRLATQIFSNSVAAAIKTAKNTSELKSDTALATAKFLKVVNNMFDALNSRHQFNKNPYKNALAKYSQHATSALNEAKSVFQKLQKISVKNDKEGNQKKNLTRPPCFEGVLITISAVTQMLNEELTDPKISYLITGKLNQDVLENLFARFRLKGGSNRNPTARLLRSVFRSTLINNLIKLPKAKNCDDEDGLFLQLTDKQITDQNCTTSCTNVDSVECGPSSSPQAKHVVDAIAGPSGTLNTHDKITGVSNISLEECSLKYFTGYLAKKCLDKFSCQECNKKLIKEIDLEDKTQLLILNKSYDPCKTIKLKMPSDDLFRLIKKTVECYNKHFENIIHRKNLKKRLLSCVLLFLQCEAPELLNVSCLDHIQYLHNRPLHFS